jgi:hypothetical protein
MPHDMLLSLSPIFSELVVSPRSPYQLPYQLAVIHCDQQRLITRHILLLEFASFLTAVHAYAVSSAQCNCLCIRHCADALYQYVNSALQLSGALS